MTDLNVSLIARFVDRLSGPATAAAGRLGALAAQGTRLRSVSAAASAAMDRQTGATARTAQAAGGLTRAAASAAASTARLGGVSAAAAGSAETLGRAARTAAAGQAGAASAARAMASAEDAAGSSSGRAGQAAETAARRFSLLERMQHRGRAAARLYSGELATLNSRLATAARASIVGDSLARGGGRVAGVFGSAANASAAWERRLMGVQLQTGAAPGEIARIGQSIMANAQAVAMPWERSAGITAAVLNEGAYRSAVEQAQVSRSVLKLSQLADVTMDPISDEEAGALTSALAYSLGAPAARLDRQMAMIYKGAQLGGVKTGTMGRYMPTILGGVAAMGDRSDLGLATSIAGMQIVKRRAGTDDQAGEYFRDLVNDVNQAHTRARFKKIGIDLPAEIIKAQGEGLSGLDGVLRAVGRVIGDAKGERAEAKMKGLFVNQYSGAAAAALLENYSTSLKEPSFKSMRSDVLSQGARGEFDQAVALASSGQQAEITRRTNAQAELAQTTGQNIAGATVAANRALGGAAELASRAQRAAGPLGTAAALAGAGAGYTMKAAGGVVQAAIGAGSTLLVLRSMNRLGGLGARVGLGRLARSVMGRGGAAATAGRTAAGAAAGAAPGLVAEAAEVSAGRVAQAAAAGAVRAGATRAMLGRLGGIAVRAPFAELAFLPGTLGGVAQNWNTHGRAALAWATGNHELHARLTRPPTPGATPMGGTAAGQPPGGLGQEVAEIKAALAELVRALGADAKAVGDHARSMGAAAASATGFAVKVSGLALAGPMGGITERERRYGHLFDRPGA